MQYTPPIHEMATPTGHTHLILCPSAVTAPHDALLDVVQLDARGQLPPPATALHRALDPEGQVLVHQEHLGPGNHPVTGLSLPQRTPAVVDDVTWLVAGGGREGGREGGIRQREKLSAR